ncbi:MAG TPA: hypothetical protein VF812_02745 [Ktedonobacterales bacterium]
MYTNPKLSGQFAKDHQDQLLREAQLYRLAREARMELPPLSIRMRLRMSGLLFLMARAIRPRRSAGWRAAGLTRSIA